LPHRLWHFDLKAGKWPLAFVTQNLLEQRPDTFDEIELAVELGEEINLMTRLSRTISCRQDF